MSFPFNEVFVRIGHIGGILNTVNTFVGTTIPTKVNTLAGDYTTEENLISQLYPNLYSYQASPLSFSQYLQQLARSIIVNDVAIVLALPQATLSAGLNALIQSMIANTQTVNRCTISDSWSATGGNNGNPNFVISSKNIQGLPLEDWFNEPILTYCSRDAVTGGATQGQESITYLGQIAVGNPLSYAYPAGSGIQTSLNLVSGSQSQAGGSGNWLVNSDFETYTVPNVPDGWNIAVGTAGTQVVKSTSIVYTGTACLSFVGVSSVLTSINQVFSSQTAGGNTSQRMVPSQQFSVNIFLRVSSVPSAGVLEIALVDSTGTITTDGQGAQNSFTVACNTLTTSFAAFSGVFRTNNVLPSTNCQIRISFTTAIDNGVTLYLDRLAFTQMTALYQGGPYVTGFSGSAACILNDSWDILINNAYNGQFQILFDKLFRMKGLGLLLPSSVSPTISDSLIT